MLKIIKNHKYNSNCFDNDVLKIFRFTVKNVLKQKINDVSAGLLVSSRKEIKDLNKKYRNRDEETDVLSFPCNVSFANNYLGDIVVCFPVAKKQAIKYSHSLKREVCFLFLHGLLHLAGYDHESKEQEKIMFSIQDFVLGELNIKRE
jgi:probable rRNA maturation factor